MIVRLGQEDELKQLLRIARASRYTKDFSNRIYSGTEAFNRGQVLVAQQTPDSSLLGFVSFRHCVRKPQTTVYFIAVDPGHRSLGIGETLLVDLLERSPHSRIVLNCENSNTDALRFYYRLGFEELEARSKDITLEWRA